MTEAVFNLSNSEELLELFKKLKEFVEALFTCLDGSLMGIIVSVIVFALVSTYLLHLIHGL